MDDPRYTGWRDEYLRKGSPRTLPKELFVGCVREVTRGTVVVVIRGTWRETYL